jgi:hypothetical protein
MGLHRQAASWQPGVRIRQTGPASRVVSSAILHVENAQGHDLHRKTAQFGLHLSEPVPLRLRPLEIGDLLDETFRMYRRHFLLFAGISALLSIPEAAISGYGYFTVFGALLQTRPGSMPDLAALGPALVALAVGLVIFIVVLPFSVGAVTYAACESALGRPVTPGGMVRGILRRYFELLGFWLLVGVMLYIGFCLIPLWIWIWVGWVAVMPVMFIENASLGVAMGRSWRLVEGRWWRTFLILFLIGILFIVVQTALTAFVALGQFLMTLVFSSFLVLAISQAAGTIVQALVNPILQIAIVLIYFDLRVRREGLDLFQLAQRVAVPPAPL